MYGFSIVISIDSLIIKKIANVSKQNAGPPLVPLIVCVAKFAKRAIMDWEIRTNYWTIPKRCLFYKGHLIQLWSFVQLCRMIMWCLFGQDSRFMTFHLVKSLLNFNGGFFAQYKCLPINESTHLCYMVTIIVWMRKEEFNLWVLMSHRHPASIMFYTPEIWHGIVVEFTLCSKPTLPHYVIVTYTDAGGWLSTWTFQE